MKLLISLVNKYQMAIERKLSHVVQFAVTVVILNFSITIR